MVKTGGKDATVGKGKHTAEWSVNSAIGVVWCWSYGDIDVKKRTMWLVRRGDGEMTTGFLGRQVHTSTRTTSPIYTQIVGLALQSVPLSKLAKLRFTGGSLRIFADWRIRACSPPPDHAGASILSGCHFSTAFRRRCSLCLGSGNLSVMCAECDLTALIALHEKLINVITPSGTI